MSAASEAKAAFLAVAAVAETIRELGRVNSGLLYVNLLDVLSKPDFDACINTLVSAGLVARKGHDLMWAGPEILPPDTPKH